MECICNMKYDILKSQCTATQITIWIDNSADIWEFLPEPLRALYVPGSQGVQGNCKKGLPTRYSEKSAQSHIRVWRSWRGPKKRGWLNDQNKKMGAENLQANAYVYRKSGTEYNLDFSIWTEQRTLREAHLKWQKTNVYLVLLFYFNHHRLREWMNSYSKFTIIGLWLFENLHQYIPKDIYSPSLTHCQKVESQVYCQFIS